VNKADEMLGVGNCDPKTEKRFWNNEVWHCQRESQNVSLSYLDKEQEFGVRVIGCERYNVRC
jgi:hypothetical protein